MATLRVDHFAMEVTPGIVIPLVSEGSLTEKQFRELPFPASKIRDFLRGGNGRGGGGNPHPGERYNVCPRWCHDTRTVTRARHHLLC